MIGLVGLGQMGSALLRRLRKAGQGVRGYDIDAGLCAAAGAAAASSPAGVAAPSDGARRGGEGCADDG